MHSVSLCSTPVAQCLVALNIVATNTMMKSCTSQVKLEIVVTYDKFLEPKVTSHQECSKTTQLPYSYDYVSPGTLGK